MTDKTVQPRTRRRPLRVTITGFEDFWMQVLVKGLSSRFSDTLDCRWIRWPSSWSERLSFVRAMARSDVVVRLGMPFEFQSETNRLWLDWIARSKRTCGVNYWIGGDEWVFRRRTEAAGPSPADQRAIDVLSHFASAHNVADSLRSQGIPATAVVVPSPDQDVPSPPPPMPDVFRVLLYWGDGRWEYSSGPQLVEAARRLPEVQFEVVGATGRDVEDVPSNMKFYGRVSAMPEMYARCAVVVRMVEWDSVPGGMVEEGMLYARHVIYSFEFPHATFVAHADTDGLVAVLEDMRDRFKRGELGLDLEARDFMIVAWEPEARWQAMRDAFVQVYEEKCSGR